MEKLSENGELRAYTTHPLIQDILQMVVPTLHIYHYPEATA